MRTSTRVEIRTLTPDEAAELLRAHRVGRIAYSWRDHVDIVPIAYVYDGHAILARTSEGAKMRTLRHSPWVAFEVDEVDGPYDWRSVVAHGTAHVLQPNGTAADRRAYDRALELLRAREPAALTDDDPVPSRAVVLQISVDRLSGRAATRGATEASRAS
jgi:uncharacterized protein